MNDKEKIRILRAALVGLVGSSDPSELKAIRTSLTVLAPPEHTNPAVAAIDALLTVEQQPSNPAPLRICKSAGPDEFGRSVGHCYDGAGANECSFWDRDEAGGSVCRLFGEGVGKEASRCLVACDKIYGVHYCGKP
jgi:hypothetical protein